MKWGLAALVVLLAASPDQIPQVSPVPASVEAQQRQEIKNAYEKNLPHLAAEIKEAFDNGEYVHAHDQKGKILFSDIHNSKEDDVRMSGFYRSADTTDKRGKLMTSVDIDLHIRTTIDGYEFSVEAAYNNTQDLWFAQPNLNHVTIEASHPGNPVHERHTYLLDSIGNTQTEILPYTYTIQDGSTPQCQHGVVVSLLDNKGLKEFVCVEEEPSDPAVKRIEYTVLNLKDNIDAHCKR